MRLFAHNDCWCSQPKRVQSGPQLQAPVMVSSVCGTEEGRREELPEVAAEKEMWWRSVSQNPLPVPECPLTFPELLFTRGCVGCESSLLNHSIYEWRETKTRGMFRAVVRSLPEGSRVLNYQRVKQANPPKRAG